MAYWGNRAESPYLRPVANRRDTPKTGGRKYGPVFLFPQSRAGALCVVCSRSLTQLTQTLFLGFESASGPLASAASGRFCTLVASGSQRSRQRPVPARRSRSRGASRGFSVGVQVSSIGGVSRGHNLQRRRSGFVGPSPARERALKKRVATVRAPRSQAAAAVRRRCCQARRRRITSQPVSRSSLVLLMPGCASVASAAGGVDGVDRGGAAGR